VLIIKHFVTSIFTILIDFRQSFFVNFIDNRCRGTVDEERGKIAPITAIIKEYQTKKNSYKKQDYVNQSKEEIHKPYFPNKRSTSGLDIINDLCDLFMSSYPVCKFRIVVSSIVVRTAEAQRKDLIFRSGSWDDDLFWIGRP